ncbi:MAG: archaeosortase/exosortase family protein [Anaerolineales bacterium]|nr:archaeosortase/exosortase family protein [Anaerolineales bacterium]
MSTAALSVFCAVYFAGLVLLRKARVGLFAYLWDSFGLAAILIFAGQIGGWNAPLGAFQAWIVALVGNLFGAGLQIVPDGGLVVPDPTGWSILQVGIECSALIEISIFAGLILFYPRLPAGERLGRLGAGVAATLAVNLVRLAVIAALVAAFGKPVTPLAHAVVGRLVFFAGILYLYWRMLTLPTLKMVRRELEVTQRNAR